MICPSKLMAVGVGVGVGVDPGSIPTSSFVRVFGKKDTIFWMIG